jgi:hypothetical protein
MLPKIKYENQITFHDKLKTPDNIFTGTAATAT